MDLREKPPWSHRALQRLGVALTGGPPGSKNYPRYEDVMFWHSELADEVARQILEHRWDTADSEKFDVATRSKTVDTLVEKLKREEFPLQSVQDIAGVRIDADLTLTEQSRLAREVARFFGADEEVAIRDLRDRPHSGYRAVHVWLRFDSGNVEVQIRTVLQSTWANVYELLADRYGRDIRYGKSHPDPSIQELVTRMHALSIEFSKSETEVDELTRLRRSGDLEPIYWVTLDSLIGKQKASQRSVVEAFEAVKRILLTEE